MFLFWLDIRSMQFICLYSVPALNNEISRRLTPYMFCNWKKIMLLPVVTYWFENTIVQFQNCSWLIPFGRLLVILFCLNTIIGIHNYVDNSTKQLNEDQFIFREILPPWRVIFTSFGMEYNIIFHQGELGCILLNPLTACAEYIGVFTQLLPHSVPPFKHGRAIMWHQSPRFEKIWPSFCQILIISTHLKLWIASARHNFKWVKIVIE